MEFSMESQGEKRKRSPESTGSQGPSRIPQAPRLAENVASAVVPQINYLVKTRNDKLKLVDADEEIFGDVLGMLDEYEGVLQRRESLASNLGAKLVGPLLLKSFEKLFDGPIKIAQSSFALEQSPVTWLDIVSFARNNSADFVLSDTLHNMKVCRFWINGGQIEISEDDYRLIMSGAPERMIPSQPIPEDENSELGTLNILETRLGVLIKKADAVASKARQLNYHLKGRKNAIMARKASEPASARPVSFSPQPFSAINRNRSPIPVNGEAAKLQQDLLEQFHSPQRRQSLPSQPRSKQPKPNNPEHNSFQSFNGSHSGGDNQRMSHPLTNSDDGIERVLMAARIEKLHRGEPITPPCDRCRRLKFVCTKHMTACSACTKKHAKCSWKDVKEGELEATALPLTQRESPVESDDGSLFVVDKKATPEIPSLGNGSSVPTTSSNLQVKPAQGNDSSVPTTSSNSQARPAQGKGSVRTTSPNLQVKPAQGNGSSIPTTSSNSQARPAQISMLDELQLGMEKPVPRPKQVIPSPSPQPKLESRISAEHTILAQMASAAAAVSHQE